MLPQRGQRYKRLSRMLTGRVATSKINAARNGSAALVVAVVAVQTGCFVVMLLLLQQQMAQVRARQHVIKNFMPLKGGPEGRQVQGCCP